MATPSGFKESSLPQHPEVEKAYDILQADKDLPPEGKRMMVETAERIGALAQNKDPHIVAAQLIAVPLMNICSNRDSGGFDKLNAAVDPVTIEYASMHLAMVTLFEVDFQPTDAHVQAGALMTVAAGIGNLQETKKDAAHLSKSDILQALAGDPIFPSVRGLIKECGLRETEPALVAGYDSLYTELKALANGKTPGARKASKPQP